jgi:hypothetical protein
VIGDVTRDQYRLGQQRIAEIGTGLREFANPSETDPDALRTRYNVTYDEIGQKIGMTAGGGHSRFRRRDQDAINALSGIVSERGAAAATYAEQLARFSEITIVEVTDVATVGTEIAYDLETASHTFLADGFLTHNCHHIPASVYRRSADLQTKHRLGLSSTPVRESDDEDEIYTLIGPPIGTDWDSLFEAGFVAEPEVEIRYVPWESDEVSNRYVGSDGHERRQIAATNPAKLPEVEYLLARHVDKKALVFVDYLDQGRAFAADLDVPFISGEMPHSRRQRLLDEFRRGERDTLIVSRVGDEGIDLPDAELAVVASGLGGSRRQGAQRAGRTMRPEGRSLVYVLATRGSNEEEFAQRRMRHLSEKGVRVTEGEAEAVDPDRNTAE